MELKQMLYFKTIVDEGTISRAALTLHMAQPPLSMQLKSLEEEFGVPLLKRGGRQVTMTPAGSLLYKRCVQMLSLEELTVHEMHNVSQETLRIGLTSSNSPLIESDAVVSFIRDHPNVPVRVKEGMTGEMIDRLLAHDIDVGIVRTPFNAMNVQAMYFEKGPMVAIGPSHLFHEGMHALEDFRDLPWIIHRRYHHLINEYCLNTLQFNPNIHIHSDDCRTSIHWARALGEIAIIPDTALPMVDPDYFTVCPLDDQDLYTGVAIITRRGEKLSPVVEDIIKVFETQASVHQVLR